MSLPLEALLALVWIAALLGPWLGGRLLGYY